LGKGTEVDFRVRCENLEGDRCDRSGEQFFVEFWTKKSRIAESFKKGHRGSLFRNNMEVPFGRKGGERQIL